jgi:DNA-binding transcriptional LysR family regulator
VLVSSAKATGRRVTNDYLLVDWGTDFVQDHAAAFPEHANPAISLDLGPMGLDYLLANECAGYFPARMVRSLIARGRVRQPKRARKFVYPVYMVYPETRNEEAYEPILRGLRRAASKFG